MNDDGMYSVGGLIADIEAVEASRAERYAVFGPGMSGRTNVCVSPNEGAETVSSEYDYPDDMPTHEEMEQAEAARDPPECICANPSAALYNPDCYWHGTEGVEIEKDPRPMPEPKPEPQFVWVKPITRWGEIESYDIRTEPFEGAVKVELDANRKVGVRMNE